eukprot:CAMPEP_0171316502 /NCGR_PEP_ID=MMETSP0816-20121228/73260_1 /TAXON_ID=420281 /ORGANISM="Proboscia inermis, Strain CCAP1064/1" /LENGTH=37 /DNA_ID= /DNA_START= /DNA_END= /DNA_ORIENTATION=
MNHVDAIERTKEWGGGMAMTVYAGVEGKVGWEECSGN